jgi:hypothetical protein
MTSTTKTKMINHQGVNIYYIDFSNLGSAPEVDQVMKESKSFIRSQKPASMITLANIEGMHFNGDIKELFTEFVSGNKPYVKASAIVGVSGLKQIVFNAIVKMTGREIRAFENVNVAKDWLVAK